MAPKKLVLTKLEDDPIWKETCDVAEYMYSKLHEFPEDEKWETERKLRSSANDLMFTVSVAASDAAPSGQEYDWGHARKHASALQTMYRFAGRQKFIELDPEVMVRLTKLIAQIDTKVQQAYRQTEAHNKAEFEYWHKKYQVWSKTKI